MILGYARVSADDQNLETQLEELTKYGCDNVYKEKITGIAAQKHEQTKMLQEAKSGDTIVVTRMDRLGRNTLQMMEFVEELERRGIAFVVINLGIDTSTPTGKFFIAVMCAFAELERTQSKLKQRAGIELAKKSGKYKGRVRKYHEEHTGMKHALELYQQGRYTVKEIEEITNVSKSALYRAVKDKNLYRDYE